MAGRWSPVRLDRAKLLSFYFCSAYRMRRGGRVVAAGNLGKVEGCPAIR